MPGSFVSQRSSSRLRSPRIRADRGRRADADFLDHEVVVVLFDRPVKALELVSRDNREVRRESAHCFIGGQCESDRLEALRVAALTDHDPGRRAVPALAEPTALLVDL